MGKDLYKNQMRVDRNQLVWYIRGNMFDRIVYKILDTIVKWCECYKEYRIKKSLPKSAYTKEELKKWVNENEKSYK